MQQNQLYSYSYKNDATSLILFAVGLRKEEEKKRG